MSDAPKRWLEDPDAPELVRDQLQRALSVDPPPFDASAGLARFETAAQAAGASGTAAGAGTSTLQLVVLGAVLVGASVATWLSLSAPIEPPVASAPAVQPETVVMVQDDPEPPQEPAVVPDEHPATHDGGEEDAPARDPTTEAPSPKAQANKATNAGKTAADEGPDDSVRREIEALARARKALAADPKRALALVNEADREFHNGMFAEERAAIRVMALASLGKKDDAKRRAQKFLQRYPSSNFADRVRKAVAD
jgi:hypothetical protein